MAGMQFPCQSLAPSISRIDDTGHARHGQNVSSSSSCLSGGSAECQCGKHGAQGNFHSSWCKQPWQPHTEEEHLLDGNQQGHHVGRPEALGKLVSSGGSNQLTISVVRNKTAKGSGSMMISKLVAKSCKPLKPVEQLVNSASMAGEFGQLVACWRACRKFGATA